MDRDLKRQLNDCYMYGEIIAQQGFGPKKDISMADMIRFDILQFLVYLLDTKGMSLQSEITFIHEYLNQYFSADRLVRFKYERTENEKFEKTIPRSFTYFAYFLWTRSRFKRLNLSTKTLPCKWSISC